MLLIDGALTYWFIKKGQKDRKFGELVIKRLASLLKVPMVEVPDGSKVIFPDEEEERDPNADYDEDRSQYLQ
jgi:hypothetical protein